MQLILNRISLMDETPWRRGWRQTIYRGPSFLQILWMGSRQARFVKMIKTFGLQLCETRTWPIPRSKGRCRFTPQKLDGQVIYYFIYIQESNRQKNTKTVIAVLVGLYFTIYLFWGATLYHQPICLKNFCRFSMENYDGLQASYPRELRWLAWSLQLSSFRCMRGQWSGV